MEQGPTSTAWTRTTADGSSSGTGCSVHLKRNGMMRKSFTDWSIKFSPLIPFTCRFDEANYSMNLGKIKFVIL